jgi:hypothetical protein
VSERLELVTDFAQLREGMIVALRCPFHPPHHRGMLLGFKVGWVSGSVAAGTDERNGAARYAIDPDQYDHPQNVAVTAELVAAKHVYRVVDGLDDRAYAEDLAVDQTLAAIRAHQRQRVKVTGDAK